MTYRVKLGMEAKIYINDGTYAAPSWTEMGNAKDVTINLEKGEADVTVRDNNGWRAYAGTLKDGSVEFESLWISRHKGFRRIKKAYFQNESLEFAIMDGEITEPGVEGLRARGGFEVDIAWQNGKLQRALVRSLLGRECRLAYAGRQAAYPTRAGETLVLNGKLERIDRAR